MFGLFGKNRRLREPERAIPIASYGPAVRDQAEEPKAFRIALSWKGLWALIGVFFLLQLWMFLIGMWAAQTIVFPTTRQPLPPVAKPAAASGEQSGQAAERRAATAPAVPATAEAPARRPEPATTAASAPAPVAEANLPAPTAAVPPELDGQVELGPAPPPKTRRAAADPALGPALNMTDTKKRRASADEATDEGAMEIPPSW